MNVGTAVITDGDTVGTPTFCEVKEIFVINSEIIILGLMHLQTLEYSHHYHSWIVESTEDLDLLKMQSLDCQVFKPCLMKGYYHQYFITLKYTV